MLTSPQKTVSLLTFTEEIFHEKLNLSITFAIFADIRS